MARRTITWDASRVRRKLADIRRERARETAAKTADAYMAEALSAERAEAWPQAAALWRRAAECLPKHPCARLAADRDHYLANAAACDRRDQTDATLDKIANNVLRVPTLRRFGDPPAHLELTPAKLRMMLRMAYEAGRRAEEED